MRILSLVSVLSCLAGLWAGCETGEVKLLPPKSTTDLVLTPDQRDVLATVRVGSALRVILPPPIQPGYEWAIASNPGRLLRQITGLRPVPDAPGKMAVEFQSVRAARSRLLFVAIKPGQEESAVTESFSIIVGATDEKPAGPGL